MGSLLYVGRSWLGARRGSHFQGTERYIEGFDTGPPDWADLREDKKLNLMVFGRFSAPWGPTAGPASPGNGPGFKKSADYTQNQPRRQL